MLLIAFAVVTGIMVAVLVILFRSFAARLRARTIIASEPAESSTFAEEFAKAELPYATALRAVHPEPGVWRCPECPAAHGEDDHPLLWYVHHYANEHEGKPNS